MIKFKKYSINLELLIYILLFMIISILTINSSMLYLPKYLGNLALKQFLWYLVGFLLIVLSFFLPNNNYKNAYYFYFLNILLLLFLLLFGTPINGSKCWLILPGIGSLQPSEFMKIALIICTSKIVSKWSNSLNKKITIKDELILFLKVFLIFIPPVILTFLEPDTGVVFIYSIIILSILIVSPLRKRWFIFIIVFVSTIIGLFFYLYFFKQDLFINMFGTDLFYRINRLLDWKNGTGMQLENSLTAIGSSGMLGHGYKNTPIYFPESGTDFIFAVYASNFGLIGCILFLILLVLFNNSLVKIAKKTDNLTNKYIISGTIGMLLYQQLQNIGMTLGIMPITGITLPFISYGGSSLLSYFLIIGIIFKISNDTNKKVN